MAELFCKVSLNNIPDPNISGLEPSERIVSACTHLQAFFPHLKRVYDQQTDLQPPASPLLTQLNNVITRSRRLKNSIGSLYESIFPNVPLPDPAEGPTPLPPSQTVFQQKVYGCVVLKTYKEFLMNVVKELRKLRSRTY
ncbi:IL-6 subfamily cytokine M17 [Aulostomus maculatus]